MNIKNRLHRHVEMPITTTEYENLEAFAQAELHTNGHTPEQLKVLAKTANAAIVVEKTKTLVFREIPGKFIPEESFEQLFNKQWIHFLGLDKNNKLWPLTDGVPDPEESSMPTDLYMALHCEPEVNEFYGQFGSLVEKIKLGIFVGLIILIVIVIFLMVAAATG